MQAYRGGGGSLLISVSQSRPWGGLVYRLANLQRDRVQTATPRVFPPLGSQPVDSVMEKRRRHVLISRGKRADTPLRRQPFPIAGVKICSVYGTLPARSPSLNAILFSP